MSPLTPAPGETYTIRRKVLTFLGASFHVFDERGSVVGFCRQKAFRLREDLRLFTDETQSKELLRIRARQVIDFSATYDILMGGGDGDGLGDGVGETRIGSLRREGLKSSFARDSWVVLNERGSEIARLQEDSLGLGLARRMIPAAAVLAPQKFELRTGDGQLLATLRQHFNPFVYRLGVAIHVDHPELDELVILAMGFLIAAIEGRQNN